MRNPVLWIALSVIFLISLPLSAQTPVDQHGQLYVDGNLVKNSSHSPVQLRGMSFFWSMWAGEFWNDSTVNWLVSDWKVSLVRAAMGVYVDEETWNHAYIHEPEVHKNMVKTIVDAAIANGIYVIIDWHDHYAHTRQTEAIEFFSDMAQTYGSYPNVIYEIFNEPLNESWSNTLKPYSIAVIDAIRQHDDDNLIVVGTPNWCQDVDVASNDPIDRSNIVYSLHYYAASHKNSFRQKAQTALDNGVALFVTEFGTTEFTGDGSVDQAESDIWFEFLDNNFISWANWSVNDKNETSAILKHDVGASTTGGWPTTHLTESGNYIRSKLIEDAQNDGGTVYILNTAADPVAGGTIEKNPNAAAFSPDATVEITAVPAAGYSFSHWSGDVSGTSAANSVHMDAEKSVTAHFNQEDYALNVTTNGEGTVSRTPDGAVFPSNSTVTLSAQPADGWTFLNWSGDVSGSHATIEVTMDSPKDITATFRPPMHSVTWETDGLGTISRSPRANYYEHGTEIAVTAVPDTGWLFAGWSGDLSGTDNPTTLVTDASKTVTATFVEDGNSVMVFAANANPNSWSFSISNAGVVLNSPATGIADITVYDIRGRLVNKLHSGPIRTGRQNIGNLRLPVGSYVMVLRDSFGTELHREAFTMIN